MQWEGGGLLDDAIDARLGGPTHPPPIPALSRTTIRPLIYVAFGSHTRCATCHAFRKTGLLARLSNNDGDTWTGMHLLSAEEVLDIFGGVTAGLDLLVRIICLPNQIV